MPKVATCLWFERDAVAAAEFYCSLLPGSRVDHVQSAPGDYPAGKAGDPLIVDFTLAGQAMQGLNGGQKMAANSSAASIAVACDDQAEIDRLWAALTADGGTEIQCGWLNDRWGIPWQIFPRRLPELLADPDPARARRAFQAMMTMVKIDLAAIEAAAA